MPLKKSLLFAARPFSAVFRLFAIRCVAFQNGLFFGVFGSRPLSARAALIMAARAFFAAATRVCPLAFFPLGFFCAVFAVYFVFGVTARATANVVSEMQTKMRTKFLIFFISGRIGP